MKSCCLFVFTQEPSFQGSLGGAGFYPSTVHMGMLALARIEKDAPGLLTSQKGKGGVFYCTQKCEFDSKMLIICDLSYQSITAAHMM